MLYMSGYISNCIANTLNVFLICFTNINNIFDYKNNEKYKNEDNFYNYNNLSKLQEVVIYNKPKKLERSKSESQLEFKHDYHNLTQKNKNNDNEWDILS